VFSPIVFFNNGVSGIANVMPFTCMPGTIATAVLKRVREDHNDIPLLNIAYEGQGDSQTITRLEAFMHQARSYQRAKKG
jgi:predicted nucleotide-binding protein (sugar kinase/HSP70/actin superfamily)